jgi:alkyl hydroperoxide reductase subunit AhpC
MPPSKPIRLGSKCPDFTAETTQGRIGFYEQIEGSWAIIFAFPDDFTPVATTELVTFTQLQAEFAKRSVKLFALSTNNTRSEDGFESHKTWVKDINEISQTPLVFPIISDTDGTIFRMFNLLGDADVEAVKADDAVGEGLAFKSRTVFIVDAKKQFRLIFNYPAAVGINTAEVLRAVDCLQTAARADVRTPAHWVPGGDVIVPPKYSDEEAEKSFPGYVKLKPYLRVYKLPVEETNQEKIEDISKVKVEEFLTV